MSERPKYDPQYVRRVSERVYRVELNRESGEGSDQQMVAEDGDDGTKLRNRAAAYDRLTRVYLHALEIKPS